MIETSLVKQDKMNAKQYEYDQYLLIQKYKELHCSKCKNKGTDLCCITITIDNKVKCVEYESCNK